MDEAPSGSEVTQREGARLPKVHIVGIGLAGVSALSAEAQAAIASATLIVATQRHLNLLGDDTEASSRNVEASVRTLAETSAENLAETWVLNNLSQTLLKLKQRLRKHPQTKAAVLATGDPLFFGLGRLLLEHFPSEQLIFHPQVSSVQLAFSRLKLPWQDAQVVSVHGRGETLLVKALKKGTHKVAVLTDNKLTPAAIARLLQSLDLPVRYHLWVCENLGSAAEKISVHNPHKPIEQDFSPLNVVVLVRRPAKPPTDAIAASKLELPLIGLPDSAFKGFPDRPTLMTKREVRALIISALAPRPGQVFWDVGSGTGAISVELSRLCTDSCIYAIEKTAIGAALTRHNADNLAIAPVHVVQGKAPEALKDLPQPACIFIGGSGGHLVPILNYLHERFWLNQHPSEQSFRSASNSPLPIAKTASTQDNNELKTSVQEDHSTIRFSIRIVLAIATIEHLAKVTSWVSQASIVSSWQVDMTQINIARSLPVANLTRFSPLNPLTLVTLETKHKKTKHEH